MPPKGRKKKATKTTKVVKQVIQHSSDSEDAEPVITATPPDVVITATPPEPVILPVTTSTPKTTHTPEDLPDMRPAKRAKKHSPLTTRQEDDMIDWIKDNPCLYNKKLDIYRDRQLKLRLWKEKAKEFVNTDIDVEYLQSWYKSIRIRYSKLSKVVTGSGAQDHTERDDANPSLDLGSICHECADPMKGIS